MKNTLLLNRGQWVAVFFFICFAVITYQTFLIARPFLPGFLGAVMLGIFFSPVYEKVLKRVDNPSAASFILTLGIFLLTVIPVVLLGWMAFNEAENLPSTLTQSMGDYQTPAYLQKISQPLVVFFEGYHLEIKPLFLDEVSKLGAQMSAVGKDLAGHLLIVFFNGLVLMLTLFFVFRDGKKGSEVIISILPMSRTHKQALLKRIYETFRAVVAGIFVTALAEGFLDLAGFFAAGVPLAVFFGLAVAVFSLFGASVLITIPAAFWVMNHDTGMGIFLLVWGILVSVLSDNVLKAALIGSKARMPFLLMLFSILGGLKLYGVMGMFLGPMMLTAFLSFCHIYQKEYKF